MSKWLGGACGAICGFSAGIIIATGIVAFLLVLGIVPRLVEKTNTRTHFLAVETAAFIGIIVGNAFVLWDIHLVIPKVIIGIISLFYGIFIGCLSIAIAEILDIIPVTKMRLNLKKGMYFVLICFAMGKLAGSLYYWFYPTASVIQ